METDTITHLILQYRYWMLIVLALIEGPIVAFVAGTLAAAGYFNPFFLEFFFIVRDLVVDVAYYALGLLAGQSMRTRRLLEKVGVTSEHLESARTLWQTHPLRTMFLGKLSYGIAPSFFVVAGMVRMSLAEFVGYNAGVAAVQYGALLVLGYFFGSSLGLSVVGIINNVQYLIGAIVIVYIVLFVARSFFRKRLTQEETDLERDNVQ
jgi:membrane protein DedA with SNARE-associated domain